MDRRTALALFVLAFVPYCWFYGGWGANQEANFALTRSIVEARTLHVDDFTVHEGDIAAGAGGHIYINRPPGLSLLGVVPYKIQRAVERRAQIQFRDYWRTNKMMVTVAVCGLCGALIAPILYLYGRRLGAHRWNAAAAAIAVAFGTIVLPYSTMYFAHVPSALFLLVALVLLRERPLLAGLAAGVAGACFFVCAIAAVLLIPLAWHYAPRKAAWFVAGGVPIAIGLAVYQWICFGSPFTAPLQRSAAYTEKGLLLGVFGRVDASRLWGLTFSEYRGLFCCSPILLLAFVGAALMMRRARAELAAIAAITIVFFAVMISFNGWHGGAAFGPRYLVPVIPLMAIAMMFAGDRGRWVWIAAGAVSIAINVAATAVDPMPEPEVMRPLTGYILPSLARGRVALVQDSGNLGELLFGKGNALSIVPAALWIVAGSWWILAAAARDPSLRSG